MTDPDIEAACEDITKGLKTHRGCSPATEQDFLEDNIATLAFHLGQPGARLSVQHWKSGVIIEPGEVLKEASRRLGLAQGSPDRDEIAKPQERTYTLAEVSDTVERVIRKMLDDGQIVASPVPSTERERG